MMRSEFERMTGIPSASNMDAWFARLLNEQHYACALCKSDFTTLYEVRVDVDVETGRVRGLLCLTCFEGATAFGGDYDAHHRVLDYLAGDNPGDSIRLKDKMAQHERGDAPK